jgi:hypothetical protein
MALGTVSLHGVLVDTTTGLYLGTLLPVQFSGYREFKNYTRLSRTVKQMLWVPTFYHGRA